MTQEEMDAWSDEAVRWRTLVSHHAPERLWQDRVVVLVNEVRRLKRRLQRRIGVPRG